MGLMFVMLYINLGKSVLCSACTAITERIFLEPQLHNYSLLIDGDKANNWTIEEYANGSFILRVFNEIRKFEIKEGQSEVTVLLLFLLESLNLSIQQASYIAQQFICRSRIIAMLIN